MLSKQLRKCKQVTIIGDTSNFHLGSKLNYNEFRKLIGKKYNILQEIPYDAFGITYIEFQDFFKQIKKSKWWREILNSDILIVHGEGLTEKRENYVYYYLYFSRIAKEIGIESWLVNFSMYEGAPFLNLLKNFSYIACRDILTYNHLSEFKLDLELSFDCSILTLNIEKQINHNSSIAAIRGRNAPEEKILKKFKNHIKYNCCWQWGCNDAVSYSNIYEYIPKIKKAQFALSSSFHGNIISYICGIPFISLDNSNKKYLSLNMELLPENGKNITLNNYRKLGNIKNRKEIYDYYIKIFDSLKKRALLNCI